MRQTGFREIFESLRNKVSGTKAILIVGSDGILVDHLVADSSFDVESFAAEYATLLRIARRMSEDTGTGKLVEHIVVSDHSIIVARNISSAHFLILVSGMQEQIGRARYELKQAAMSLETEQFRN